MKRIRCDVKNIPSLCLAIFYCAAFGGCEVSVSEKPHPNNNENRFANNDIKILDDQLSNLQSELSSMDSTLSSDIASLRSQLRDKVDKEDVVELVKKEVQRVSQRLSKLDLRSDEVEKRIDKLEEHFGILSREPDAPWYDGSHDE